MSAISCMSSADSYDTYTTFICGLLCNKIKRPRGAIGEGKGNIDLYSASSRTLLAIWITQCYLQTTPYLSLPVSISQAEPSCIYAQRTPEFNLLLIYRPQENEWLSWPCWLTYSGQFAPRRSPVNCTSWRRPGKVRWS